MPARIIVIHNDSAFVEHALATLRDAGYGVTLYASPLAGLGALESTDNVGLLITQMEFGRGQPSGVSIARMIRIKRHIKIIFVAPVQYARHSEDLGAFLALPVGSDEPLTTVRRLLAQDAATAKMPSLVTSYRI